MKFNELKLRKAIVDATIKAGYEEMTPIQEKAIPVILDGKDVMACAQTGTGKTAAFALPILERLADYEDQKIRALVLTPTRELAVQIFENFKKFGRYLKLRDCCVYGGAPMSPQRQALYRGCDILIATPGRLNMFMDQGILDLSKVEVFVLDEADRMLDMGFIGDVKKIINDLPDERQTILLSATMPKEIQNLASELLRNPVEIRTEPQASPVETVEQYLVFCEKGDKKRVLCEMLRSEDMKKGIIFTRTKAGAEHLMQRLEEAQIKALAIHGDKTQGQRMNALQRFRTNQVNVLVATDVAARGIDVADITHVFNYDMPEDAETYIHRIGRSGRAGKNGTAVSLCCNEEIGHLADIEKMLKHPLPEMETVYTIPLNRLKNTPKKKNYKHRVSDTDKTSKKQNRKNEKNTGKHHRQKPKSGQRKRKQHAQERGKVIDRKRKD